MTSPARAGRRGRLTSGITRRLTAGAVVAGLMALAPAAAATTPSPTPAPGSGLPITVELASLRPFAPQPGSVIRIAGSLRNVSTSPATGLHLALQMSSGHVGSRGEFDQYADTPDGPPPTSAVAVPTATVVLHRAELAPGSTERFRLSVPVDDLPGLQPWEVYELALVVTGTSTNPAAPGTTTLGRLRTFLPYAPVDATGVGQRVRLAWVWPLVDRPHGPDSSTWADDLLAPELRTTGRLGGLVAAAEAAAAQHRPPAPPRKRGKHHHARPRPPKPPLRPVPVTWTIDPMLVDDATHMAAGYRVGNSGKAGGGQAVARTWLAALHDGVGSGEVLALPYADPDLTASDHAGLDPEVQVARTTGEALVQHELGVTPLTYAWPPGGSTDQRTLDSLFAAGATTVLLDSQALPVVGPEPNETLSATATARARDGNLSALLSDHGLAAVAEAGATDPATSGLQVQRLLSELLMIQAEFPTDQRSLVVAPSRRWAPAPAYAAELLSATGQVPWVQPVTLSRVAARPPSPKIVRGPIVLSPLARQSMLRHGYLARVLALSKRVDAFASILPAGDAQARDFDGGVLRLLSSAWQAQPAAADALRRSFSRTVENTRDMVRIASRASSVTLTSHSGTVPVTVLNDLDRPVTVVVRIGATPHLVVRGGDTPRRIPAHTRVPVDVRATAQTSGTFPLTVTLFTPTHPAVRYSLKPVTILVRSTAYGTTALLITGGATAMLLIAVAVRLVRRARSARRAAAT
ncbi:MAG: hypothetical protein JO222_11460 [Frankiales bacterium]|nr:hypothetical protein [Frankiales bacterium]